MEPSSLLLRQWNRLAPKFSLSLSLSLSTYFHLRRSNNYSIYKVESLNEADVSGRNVSWTNPDESRILANLGRLNRKMSYYDILHVALLPQKPKGWLNSQDMEHLSTWRWSLTSVVFWAEVVAQLVEQLLPEPEVRSSNPDIDKVILNIVYCIEKTKNRKGSWEWSIYK